MSLLTLDDNRLNSIDVRAELASIELQALAFDSCAECDRSSKLGHALYCSIDAILDVIAWLHRRSGKI